MVDLFCKVKILTALSPPLHSPYFLDNSINNQTKEPKHG